MQLLALASILLSVVFDGKYEKGNFARRMEACNALCPVYILILLQRWRLGSVPPATGP